MRLFLTKAWYLVGLFLALALNPEKLLRNAGLLKPTQTLAFNVAQFRIFIAVLLVVALYVWFHRQRLSFERGRAPRPSMPFHEVMRRIAWRSAWAAACHSDDDGHWIERADHELTRALATGEVAAWGYLVRGNQTDLAPSLIPKDFWLLGQFHGSDMVLGEVPPTGAYRFDRHGGGSYRDVRFDSREVAAAWPTRSWLSALRRRSPAERTGATKLWLAFDRLVREGKFVLKAGEGFRKAGYG